MRAGIVIIGLISLTVGCSSKPAPTAYQQRQDSNLRYADDNAATLAFDPPVAQDNPRLNMSRSPREASAFVGFDQSITTFFYVRSDDRQTDDHRNDRYERRAISEQFGTSYR